MKGQWWITMTQASRAQTSSAIASELVNPGDSMPSRFTRPGTP
jgi:hypothetical protein